MTVDATEVPWPKRAEAAIRSLRDVEAASIQTEDDEIREIHVLTSSTRPAKQIVRDVQTLLLTKFNRSIDHRVVSVAYADPARAADRPELESRAESATDESPNLAAEKERIRFTGVNLYVSGARTQAQVELRWKGLPRISSASGIGTRERSHRTIAAATVAATQEDLGDTLALSGGD